uniref:N-acetyltransferase domain-containing protein n=1 Tax=Meloidogyne enterolobii TaxID=390850 RepID=A0A6V7XQD8_MELEN|nr:unnamed protein product [Meloidogyne enterolobii]
MINNTNINSLLKANGDTNIYCLNPLTLFNIQKAQQTDLNEILEFIFADFLFTEPLNDSLGLTRLESEKFFEKFTWDLVPSTINCLASWLIISVSSEYKRRGIAEALLNYNLEEMEKFGCQGLIAEASAFNSQKLFQKMGYSRLFEIKHSDWKGEDGKQIFNCKDGTDKITLEFKQFKNIKELI